MKKITAGRDNLGEFAPKFAQLNDDVLFGEVWSREAELPARDRSLITVTALMAQGLTDTSFRHHLEMSKENGISRSEIAEILTHAAFYAGWPKRMPLLSVRRFTSRLPPAEPSPLWIVCFSAPWARTRA